MIACSSAFDAHFCRKTHLACSPSRFLTLALLAWLAAFLHSLARIAAAPPPRRDLTPPPVVSVRRLTTETGFLLFETSPPKRLRRAFKICLLKSSSSLLPSRFLTLEIALRLMKSRKKILRIFETDSWSKSLTRFNSLRWYQRRKYLNFHLFSSFAEAQEVFGFRFLLGFLAGSSSQEEASEEVVAKLLVTTRVTNGFFAFSFFGFCLK